jgi:hypothetical protein
MFEPTTTKTVFVIALALTSATLGAISALAIIHLV